MKYCPNSYICPWGDAFTPNRCAYAKEDGTDVDYCPMILESYEISMIKLCGNPDQAIS